MAGLTMATRPWQRGRAGRCPCCAAQWPIPMRDRNGHVPNETNVIDPLSFVCAPRGTPQILPISANAFPFAFRSQYFSCRNPPLQSTSAIPYADTPCHLVTQAAATDDIVSTTAFGIAVALLIAAFDETYTAADQAPLAPLLDAERGAELAASMREYAEGNPAATLEDAVRHSYNAMRAALTRRPKLH